MRFGSGFVFSKIKITRSGARPVREHGIEPIARDLHIFQRAGDPTLRVVLLRKPAIFQMERVAVLSMDRYANRGSAVGCCPSWAIRPRRIDTASSRTGACGEDQHGVDRREEMSEKKSAMDKNGESSSWLAFR